MVRGTSADIQSIETNLKELAMWREDVHIVDQIRRLAAHVKRAGNRSPFTTPPRDRTSIGVTPDLSACRY